MEYPDFEYFFDTSGDMQLHIRGYSVLFYNNEVPLTKWQSFLAHLKWGLESEKSLYKLTDHIDFGSPYTAGLLLEIGDGNIGFYPKDNPRCASFKTKLSPQLLNDLIEMVEDIIKRTESK